MRARAVAAVAAMAVGAILALGASAPANAAGPTIEVSRDGASWAATLSGSVFGDARLVPNDAIERSFFIRNNAPSAGYLRITLRDVTTDNLDFAGALRVRADLVGWPGENVAVSAARPCARLAEGPVLPSGGVARVELSALLGDLEGQHGQGGWTGFQIVLSLSGQPVGLGATGCPVSGAEIAGYSPTPRGGSRFFPGGSGTFYASTAGGWMPSTFTPGTTTPDTAPAPIDTPTVPDAHGIRVASNTTRFYQEYDAALWLVAALLGAVAAWTVLRRRPRAVPEDGTDPKGAPR